MVSFDTITTILMIFEKIYASICVNVKFIMLNVKENVRGVKTTAMEVRETHTQIAQECVTIY